MNITAGIKHPKLSVARIRPAVVPYHQYVIVAGGIGDDDNVLDSIEVFDVTKSHWMIVNTQSLTFLNQ